MTDFLVASTCDELLPVVKEILCSEEHFDPLMMQQRLILVCVDKVIKHKEIHNLSNMMGVVGGEV